MKRGKMISELEFEEIVVNVLERNISSNEDQKKAILSTTDQSLFFIYFNLFFCILYIS